MPGGGTLRITAETVQLDESHACIAVADTGTGIAPELLENSRSSRRRRWGTGLGLASVHGTVTQAGGRIPAGGAGRRALAERGASGACGSGGRGDGDGAAV
jgi:C4-dicarboxylate-specific signal transduction histidine kinase